MVFCNPEPIAAACFLARDVVKSAIEAFSAAIIDLTTLNYNLTILLGFVKLVVKSKTLKYFFKNESIQVVNHKTFEGKVPNVPFTVDETE